MSDHVIDHDALLWVDEPWNYMNPDISGSSNKQLDLGSKTQTPNEGKMAAPVLPVRGQKKAKKSDKKGKTGDGVGSKSDHELRIWTERERRKKMKNSYASLLAMLPQLPAKTDQSTIIDEAVAFIKHCQQKLQSLNKHKLERLHGITSNMNNEQSLVTLQTLLESRESFMADQVASNNYSIATSNTFKATMTACFNVPLSFQSFSAQNVILNIAGEQAFINICAPKRQGLFSRMCIIVEQYNLQMMSSHVTSDLDKMTIMMQFQTKIAADRLPVGFPVEEVYKRAAVEMMNVVQSYQN